MPKAGTKRKDPEDEEDIDDPPAASLPKPSGSKKGTPVKSSLGSTTDAAAATSATSEPKKKKKKPIPEPEPEPEPEEPEPEEPEEAGREEDPDKKAKRKKKAKHVGYRTLARKAGYIAPASGDMPVNSGMDGTGCMLSISDAKRLMRFVPSTPGATGFDVEEFKKRFELFKSGVPDSAARETQARADAAMRAIMNQAVLRTAEAGRKSVSASIMMSVLRPYADKMLFTAVNPPVGLIRHAQDEGVLAATEKDKNDKADEKKDSNKCKQIADAWTKEVAEARAARKAAKAGRNK